MPTYEYLCKECGASKEEFKSIKDDSVPSCCNKPMQIVISGGGGTIFKGEGWASQDFKRQAEDGYITSVSKRARDLKTSGQVDMSENLSFKDVERLNPE